MCHAYCCMQGVETVCFRDSKDIFALKKQLYKYSIPSVKRIYSSILCMILILFSFILVTLRIDPKFFASVLAFHTQSTACQSYLTNESDICFHGSYTKDITTSMCKDERLVSKVDVILLRERASPSRTLQFVLGNCVFILSKSHLNIQLKNSSFEQTNHSPQ